jgi:hypothetical protein
MCNVREDNLHADDREASPGQLDAWIRLAAAILAAAARDAQAGDLTAARWLLEPAGLAEMTADLLDLDYEEMCRQARQWEQAAFETARACSWRIRIFTQEVNCEPGTPTS